MDYVEAMDKLLGFVGSEVLVRVGDAEHHVGFVMLHGPLAQGEAEGLAPGQVSFFAVGDGGSDGLFIDRGAFTAANYDAEGEKLTIWLGPVAISVEPHVAGYRPDSPTGD